MFSFSFHNFLVFWFFPHLDFDVLTCAYVIVYWLELVDLAIDVTYRPWMVAGWCSLHGAQRVQHAFTTYMYIPLVARTETGAEVWLNFCEFL